MAVESIQYAATQSIFNNGYTTEPYPIHGQHQIPFTQTIIISNPRECKHNEYRPKCGTGEVYLPKR